MNKSPRYNQQSKSEVEEIYLFTKTWKVAVTASKSENKLWVSSMPEKIPSSNI